VISQHRFVFAYIFSTMRTDNTVMPSIPEITSTMTIEQAAVKIQSMYRVRMARKRLRALLKAVVERFYDGDSGMCQLLLGKMIFLMVTRA